MKVLFFDTESTSLSAIMGRLLCCSFATSSGKVFTYRVDKPKYRGVDILDDSRLTVAIRDELESADIFVGWNSKLHDVPLLNARLSLAGERPFRPSLKTGTMHLDIMWYARGQSMKIGSSKLDNVAKYFKTQEQKTELDWRTWQLAGTGDRKAMDEVVVHCEQDVLTMRELWPHLAPYIAQGNFTVSEVWPFLEDMSSRRSLGSS